MIDDSDIAGIIGAGGGKRDYTGARNGEGGTATIGAGRRAHVIGEFFQRAVGRGEAKLAVALLVVEEIDPAIVGSPMRVVNVAVELVRNRVWPDDLGSGRRIRCRRSIYRWGK